MTRSDKRSVSLPVGLAEAIERAAAVGHTTFSGWLAEAASHRLRLEAGQAALAEWETQEGPLTPGERAEGRLRARAALGRSSSTASRRTA
ncbi:MAG: hypothetical protein ACT4OS_06190 [Acidimicrobiales bacterium]